MSNYFVDTVNRIMKEKFSTPPKCYVHTADDGSIYHEWMTATDSWRFGICIDPNPKDSSWYLVSAPFLEGKKVVGFSCSDFLVNNNFSDVIEWIFNYPGIIKCSSEESVEVLHGT